MWHCRTHPTASKPPPYPASAGWAPCLRPQALAYIHTISACVYLSAPVCPAARRPLSRAGGICRRCESIGLGACGARALVLAGSGAQPGCVVMKAPQCLRWGPEPRVWTSEEGEPTWSVPRGLCLYWGLPQVDIEPCSADLLPLWAGLCSCCKAAVGVGMWWRVGVGQCTAAGMHLWVSTVWFARPPGVGRLDDTRRGEQQQQPTATHNPKQQYLPRLRTLHIRGAAGCHSVPLTHHHSTAAVVWRACGCLAAAAAVSISHSRGAMEPLPFCTGILPVAGPLPNPCHCCGRARCFGGCCLFTYQCGVTLVKQLHATGGPVWCVLPVLGAAFVNQHLEMLVWVARATLVSACIASWHAA
jgi:hypothetical protein